MAASIGVAYGAANGLIMAKSSLSHVAGLLSKGSVYYEPFWHGPLSSWRVLPKPPGRLRQLWG
jgi:hypothetical protein